MKKTAKALILALAVVSMMFALTGCGKSKEEKSSGNSIVGTWTYQSGGYTYVFNEDGTGSYVGKDFTYKTEGNKISITYNGSTAAFESEYSINGDTLNIKDSFGNDTIYKRK